MRIYFNVAVCGEAVESGEANNGRIDVVSGVDGDVWLFRREGTILDEEMTLAAVAVGRDGIIMVAPGGLGNVELRVRHFITRPTHLTAGTVASLCIRSGVHCLVDASVWEAHGYDDADPTSRCLPAAIPIPISRPLTNPI